MNYKFNYTIECVRMFPLGSVDRYVCTRIFMNVYLIVSKYISSCLYLEESSLLLRFQIAFSFVLCFDKLSCSPG